MKTWETMKLHIDGSIATVTLDATGQPVNTWSQQAMEDFGQLLDTLEQTANLAGVILVSGKTGNFHAGGDLKLMSGIDDRDLAARVLDEFHELFRRLEGLAATTVAAVDGHCLGGGLELALACSARIAKDTKRTMLGLPECQVGLFPGGGGTQRLPRLIGIPAVELVLKGTVMPAGKAHEMGIVDRLVPEDRDLFSMAKAFVQEINADGSVLKRTEQDFSGIGQVADPARSEVLKTTRGRELPGPMMAIKAMEEGLPLPLEQGLARERELFVDVLLSNQAKGSIHTYFLKTMGDNPRNLMSPQAQPKDIQTVGLLGFGTMGRGIAVEILRNTDMLVIVKDLADALEPGRELVRGVVQGRADKGKLKTNVDDMLSRLRTTSEYADSLAQADLIIEAVFEDVSVKKDVYGELCTRISDDCIIATNTSAIPVNTLAQFVTSPERFAGLHFFSPVWMMQLVEIVSGDRTSRRTVDSLIDFSASIRKRPILCKDNPGFVVNAVLFPYLVDALDFMEHGISIDSIDQAFVRFGLPVGPIRLIDEVGIDVPYSVLKGRGIEQATLDNMVSAGRLGLKKSGKGFFLRDGAVDPEVEPLIARKEPWELSAEAMQEQVLTDMVKVGKDLLDRNIVDDPRMVDIGMIWGMGFPPDRGGPLKWADLTGLSQKLFGEKLYG